MEQTCVSKKGFCVIHQNEGQPILKLDRFQLNYSMIISPKILEHSRGRTLTLYTSATHRLSFTPTKL